MSLINVSGLSKIQGGETLYRDVNFQINAGEKVGLVGPNGAGKSTLFRMIIGEDRPDTGHISLAEKTRMAYFSQNVGEMKGETAIEVVMSGDQEIEKLRGLLSEFEQKLCDPDLDPDEMNKILEKMGDVQTEFERRGGYDIEARAEEIMTGLGVAPEEHQKDMGFFSGGQKMRIALARTLVINPDLILMDEPTNYLDLETIEWLEQWLKEFEGAIFMTTHDRFFMNGVCKKTIEVFNRRVYSYSGNYDFYQKERKLRIEQIKSEHRRQAESIAKDEAFIEKFKARASHAAQVQSRVKKLEKIERIEIPPEEKNIDFEFASPGRGSDDVVVIKNLSRVFPAPDGTEKLIFKDLSTTIKRGLKLAVVGVNGAGKSTLLKIMAQQLEPSTGSSSLGPSIQMGYFGQFALDNLDAEKTVVEQAQGALPNASDGLIRNLLAAFLFRGDEVEKRVRILSGGEKSRLVLAILMAQRNNLLILDEPTNHLDIASRQVLLKALKNFEGTVIFVSHDRHFLRELADTVYCVDQSAVTLFPGGYEYYLEKTRLG